MPWNAVATDSRTSKTLAAGTSGRDSTASAGSVSASTVDVALGAVAPYPQRSEATDNLVVVEARNIRASQIGQDV